MSRETEPTRSRGMRLEHQAMFAVLTLLAVTIGAVIALQSLAGVWWLEGELRRESRVVTHHYARELARPGVRTDEARRNEVIEMALHDPHVAFMSLRDAQGNEIARRVRDSRAFAGYERAVTDCAGHVLCESCASVAILGPDTVSGHATSEAIWDDQELLGVLTVGIVDPAYSAIAAHLVRAGVSAGLIVGVFAVPAVAMGARRLIAPLRRVAAAAEALASGGDPEPLRCGGPREVDSLARSFNDMADSLAAASRELREANSGLESTVRERTRELRRVNARLEFELAERGRFFRAMSHDLGAPLRNIAGSLVLVRKRHGDALPEDTLNALDRIERCVELELRMITELLEITRIGAAEERPEVVETLALAHEVRGSLEHDLRTREIELAIDASMPVIRVEGARFRQVLQNLLDNAIKYMPAREPRRISISARVGEGGAEFSVTDTGGGIPAREHERIFEVFRRASNIPEGVAGAGVGLAAVKGIVERWGGVITVESELGAGSRFSFTVPADRLVSVPPAGEPAGSGNGRNIPAR